MASKQSAPNFKTNVNRNKTQKWVKSSRPNYDGDDWGDDDDDEYDDTELDLIPSTGAQQPYPSSPSSVHQRTQSSQQPPFMPQPLMPRPNTGDRPGPGSMNHPGGDPRGGFHNNDPSFRGPVAPLRTNMPPSRSMVSNSPIGGRDQGYGGPGPYPPGPDRFDPSFRPGNNAPYGPGGDFRTQSMTTATRREFSGHGSSSTFTSATRPPPRQSSLTSIDTAGLTQPPAIPAANSRSASPSPVFVRPADIYKRMQQEREKERLSQESSRPSIDVSNSQPNSRSESPAKRGGYEIEPVRRHQHTLSSVPERKSEYGLEAVTGSLPPLNVNQPPLPAPQQTATSPSLPQFKLGDDFGSSFGDSFMGSMDNESAQPQMPGSFKTSPIIPHAHPPSEQQAAPAFRNVVNRAFDAPSTTTSSPTISNIARSDSATTSMISPIISRNSSAGQRAHGPTDGAIKQPEVETIMEETSPRASAVSDRVLSPPPPLQQDGARPLTPVEEANRRMSTATSIGSPARTPMVEQSATLAQPQQAKVMDGETPEERQKSFEAGVPGAWNDEQAAIGSAPKNTTTGIVQHDVQSDPQKGSHVGQVPSTIISTSEHEPSSSTKHAGDDGHIERSLSTVDRPGDQESDRLRKEIYRELTPDVRDSEVNKSGNLPPPTAREPNPNKQDDRMIRAESLFLPSEYDSYWDETKNVNRGPSLTDSHPPVPEIPAAATMPPPVAAKPQEPSVANPTIRAINTENAPPLRRKFSWESEAEEITSPTKPGVEDVDMPPRATSMLGPMSAQAGPLQDQYDEFEPTESVQGAPSVKDEPVEMAEDTSVEAPAQPRLVQEIQRPDEQMAATASKPAVMSALPPGAKIPNFKDIIAINNGNERIHLFEMTRAHTARDNSGLDGWLAAMLRGHAEHKELLSNGGNFSNGVRSASRINQGQAYTQDAPAATSTPSSNRVTSAQLTAKSKDLLHSAGIISGKTTDKAKGLFARGKNKLKTMSEKGTRRPSSLAMPASIPEGSAAEPAPHRQSIAMSRPSSVSTRSLHEPTAPEQTSRSNLAVDTAAPPLPRPRDRSQYASPPLTRNAPTRLTVHEKRMTSDSFGDGFKRFGVGVVEEPEPEPEPTVEDKTGVDAMDSPLSPETVEPPTNTPIAQSFSPRSASSPVIRSGVAVPNDAALSFINFDNPYEKELAAKQGQRSRSEQIRAVAPESPPRQNPYHPTGLRRRTIDEPPANMPLPTTSLEDVTIPPTASPVPVEIPSAPEPVPRPRAAPDGQREKKRRSWLGSISDMLEKPAVSSPSAVPDPSKPADSRFKMSKSKTQMDQGPDTQDVQSRRSMSIPWLQRASTSGLEASKDAKEARTAESAMKHRRRSSMLGLGNLLRRMTSQSNASETSSRRASIGSKQMLNERAESQAREKPNVPLSAYAAADRERLDIEDELPVQENFQAPTFPQQRTEPPVEEPPRPPFTFPDPRILGHRHELSSDTGYTSLGTGHQRFNSASTFEEPQIIEAEAFRIPPRPNTVVPSRPNAVIPSRPNAFETQSFQRGRDAYLNDIQTITQTSAQAVGMNASSYTTTRNVGGVNVVTSHARSGWVPQQSALSQSQGQGGRPRID